MITYVDTSAAMKLLVDEAASGALAGRHLRSALAIHLATALRVGAEEMVVYDEELRSAAEKAGIHPLSPS
ncbi:MAG: hypothetical protein ACRD0L_07050 [Acidimicrobiales bacterium]